MEEYQDCIVRAISKDGAVNAVAVCTRAITERARQIHHTSPVATAALGRALDAGEAVIATGGGIVTREENIRMMREKGFVVWLCRPLENMIADVRQDTRPNLAGDKAERMRTLYERRERLYAAAAHLSFDNRMPPEESAKALQKLLTE